MKKMARTLSVVMATSLFTTTALPVNLKLEKAETMTQEINTTIQIADVFDRFEYDMTVVWDGKDQYIKTQASTRFQKGLNALIKSGVGAEQIQKHLENSILTKAAKAEYNTLVDTLRAQGKHESEASELAMNFAKDNYQTGSAFQMGGGARTSRVAILVGIIIVGIVTYIIIKKKKKTPTTTDGSDGTTGTDGQDGTDGSDGTDSADGTDGQDGTTGFDGHDGHDGYNGHDGHDGWDGSTGWDGSDGWNGWNGSDGCGRKCAPQ